MANKLITYANCLILLSCCILLLIEGGCATAPKLPVTRADVINSNINIYNLTPIKIVTVEEQPIIDIKGSCFWDRLRTWPDDSLLYSIIYPIREIVEIFLAPLTVPLCLAHKSAMEDAFLKTIKEADTNSIFLDKVSSEFAVKYSETIGTQVLNPKNIMQLNINRITYWSKDSSKAARRKNPDYYLIIDARCKIVNIDTRNIIADFDIYRATRHESPSPPIYVDNSSHGRQLQRDLETAASHLADCLRADLCSQLSPYID